MPGLTDPTENDIPADPPPGFRLLPSGAGGFNGLFGPLYGRLAGEALTLGFRVSHRHINPHGTCHGGVLASFADLQAYVAQRAGGVRHHVTPTISMSIDYLAPAVLGNWVEGRTTLLKATRSMLFTQTVAVVEENPVFRSSCIFKIGPLAEHPGSVLGDFFENPQET